MCDGGYTLCAVRGGSPFRAFPRQCVCIVDRKNLRHLASARLTCNSVGNVFFVTFRQSVSPLALRNNDVGETGLNGPST